VRLGSRSAFPRIVALLRTLTGQAQGSTATDRHKALSLRPLRFAESRWGICFVAAFLLLPFVYSTASAASTQDQQTQYAAHAVLISSRPAADEIVPSPPTSVQMIFSEALIPTTSKALVVDTTNRQIDLKNSHVSQSNGKEIDVALPTLSAGTYVVVWQTQSATDGHVAKGSFHFSIARPDGSVPPIPAVLPTGNVPGGGGIGVQSSTSLDGPTLLQTIATWIALLLFTFWVGGIIWETWIFSPPTLSTSDHPAAIGQASLRWRMYIPYALAGILIANIGIIVGLTTELGGDWSESFSFLFQSQFGTFWWLREGVTLLALVFTMELNHGLQPRRALTKPISMQTDDARRTGEASTSGREDQGRREARPLRGIRHLPGHLIDGIRQRSWYGRIECLLALALLVAFALSGHAASVSPSVIWVALPIDLLHLLAEAAWVGGLFYISVALLPTLNKQSKHEWADVLAIGLPRFSVIAITSVILLATTGSFNTAVHLTSFEQFWTTTYGRTLTIKIVTFLVMIGISAYHAFVLRPRLAYELAETPIGTVPAATNTDLQNESSLTDKQSLSAYAYSLGRSLEHWLRLEAMLGAIVLLCVALLAAFAGSLTVPTPPPSQPTGLVTQTKTVDGHTITLKVAPATFGTNTFTVIVKNAQGQPEKGAAVLISTTMLDMDMGTETTQLQADPNQSGVYSKQADLNMAGHWQVSVRIIPADPNANPVTTSFDFSAL
jgi:copper transport protein